MIGTPYYMAPEQVRGEDLDARADIYSLGATLYRVLTGEPPFDAPSPMSVLSKHLTDDVVPPRSRAPGRSLPPDADRIVLRAMAKSVEDRYASAAEVQQDLEHALASPGAEPRSVATVRVAPARRAGDARATGEAPTLLLGGASVRESTRASARRAQRRSRSRIPRSHPSVRSPRWPRRQRKTATWIACVAPTSTTTSGRCAGSGCCAGWCFR